jgi:hypothetical protein
MTPWGRADESEDESAYFSDDPVDFVKPKRKVIPESLNKGLMFFVFLATSSIFVGNTLAANIAINNGRVEFGQGVGKLKACSGSNSLTVKQGAEYTNAGFKLKSVEISNIPTDCYGLDLIVSVLKPGANGTGDLATLFGSVTRLVVYDKSGTFYTSQADSSYVTLTSTHDSGSNTDKVFISFNTASVLISDIGTLGVESSENVLTNLACGAGGDCVVGGTGPGGGAVVLYSGPSFSAPNSPCDLNCHGLELDVATGANYSDQWTKNSSQGFVNGSVGQGSHGLGAGYANTKRAMTSANGSLGNTTRYGAMAYCWNKTTSSATDRWYLPSVMEYAYIFKQVRDSASFRSTYSNWPASTDYYTSEEAWSGWDTQYQAIWDADSPPSGISLLIGGAGGSPITQYALAVEPDTSGNAMVPQGFAGYAKLKIWAHPKNNGYAIVCLHAFG